MVGDDVSVDLRIKVDDFVVELAVVIVVAVVLVFSCSFPGVGICCFVVVGALVGSGGVASVVDCVVVAVVEEESDG